MSFPFDIPIGTLHLPAHLVFEMLAYTIGFRYFLRLRKRTHDAISTTNRLLILLGAAFGALLGARVLGLLEQPGVLLNGGTTIAAVLSSKTIVGGLLGGLVGTECTKKIIGVRTSSGDLMTFPLILAMMIGRVGCFSAGLEDGTHGVATGLPWGIDLGDGIPRHPTNLYEILFLGLLWLFIARLERRVPLADGARFRLFLALYLLFRFCVEFIKPVYHFDFGLSSIQIACLFGLIYYRNVFLQPGSLVEESLPVDRLAEEKADS